jgi:cation diffusion facilitator CzcD-associated flavoprotein CzcO
MMNKNIAIIGAGWVGIGCLSALLKEGHRVDLFERNDDIGGVWHPCNCYAGLSLHGPAFTVEYHDFPLPAGIDRADHLTSAQVHQYLKAYCTARGLYAHMNFQTAIERISYDSETKKCRILVREQSEPLEYDYVIYTHGSADRTVPNIAGTFAGHRYHSFDVNLQVLERLVADKKRVTIVGGSKTATEMVKRFHLHGHPTTWLYRKNYWFLDETPYRRILREALRGKRSGGLYKFFYRLGDRLAVKFPRLNFNLWRLGGVIHTYGEKHTDFKKFHGGRIDREEMAILKACNAQGGVVGEIDSYCPQGLRLTDGRIVESDCVIFCTGSAGCRSLVDVDVDGEPFPVHSVRRVYRARVIPEIPNLIFTANSDFSIGTVNGLIYGKWIARYIAANLTSGALQAAATDYHTPFFGSHFLFDSSEYFLAREFGMLEPFFESGELNRAEVAAWRWQFEFGGVPLPPFEFRDLKPADR